MNKFKIILVDPKPVTLNLRAAARKFEYYSSSKLADELGWDSRRLRRILSGFQEPKPSALRELGKIFNIEAHHFLKGHCHFVDYLNTTFPEHNISVPEIKGVFDMQEVKTFTISIFGYNQKHAVLNHHQGFFRASEILNGTEEEVSAIFEKRCLESDEVTGTVVIAELLYEGTPIQIFNRERYDIMIELLKKTCEIWNKVNPDLYETIEFRSSLS